MPWSLERERLLAPFARMIDASLLAPEHAAAVRVVRDVAGVLDAIDAGDGETAALPADKW